MAKLESFWIETDLEDAINQIPVAIRASWDNDRHQRMQLKGNSPIQVIDALKGMVELLECELYENKI